MTAIVRFSLHTARMERDCSLCGEQIPVGGEFWRTKGAERALAICCLCRALYGLPTDGWERAPDGREVIATAVPATGRHA